jgi:hypothetical protein
MINAVSVVLPFYFCLFTFAFLLSFSPEAKKQPPIIGRTYAFDAKIYKIVGGVFAVSACVIWNKKNYLNSDFCLALPSLLVENHLKPTQLPGVLLI